VGGNTVNISGMNKPVEPHASTLTGAEAVVEMLPEEAAVQVAEADDPDFWGGLRDWFN